MVENDLSCRSVKEPAKLCKHAECISAVTYVPPGPEGVDGDDDPDPDARFWELHCAINAIPPGPADTWTVRGQELGQATVQPDWRPARAVKSIRPSL